MCKQVLSLNLDINELLPETAKTVLQLISSNVSMMCRNYTSAIPGTGMTPSPSHSSVLVPILHLGCKPPQICTEKNVQNDRGLRTLTYRERLMKLNSNL